MEYCLTRFWSNTERKFLKALLFGGLELLVNVQSKFNTVIKYNYHWDIIEAINQTNFQGLMFYPCLYKSVRKTIVLTNEKPAEWRLYQFSRFESCFFVKILRSVLDPDRKFVHLDGSACQSSASLHHLVRNQIMKDSQVDVSVKMILAAATRQAEHASAG